AVGTVPRAGRARMSLRDQLDDREAEPGAAVRPGLVAAAEAVERARQERLREPGSLVGHVQLDEVAALARRQRHRAAAVQERILDEVAERLLEAIRIRIDCDRVSGLDRDPAAVRR